MRRSSRIASTAYKPNYNYHVKQEVLTEPTTVHEAISGPEANHWHVAMKEEFDSLLSNNTWSLVDLPNNKKPINCKWVFKKKHDANGDFIRHKARLVVKGFSQQYGIDYSETFAPVVRYTSIRFLLAIAAKYNLEIRQMDAVTAFLNGDLKEEIYMCQPEQFNDGTNRVCKLNKSLYGLKQSSRVWNEKLNSVLINFGLQRCDADQCIYYHIHSKKMLFMAV